jgi:hypothetical protein
VVIPAKAGDQYAAAPRFITTASGILDRPVKPGDDGVYGRLNGAAGVGKLTGHRNSTPWKPDSRFS